mmetsp:Transcript_9623/g.35721  ORF Transcript_9623/g.35721 Transcript_9623/m.35721 type:complete len:365 (-) Transcript_9623:829-1923(-)
MRIFDETFRRESLVRKLCAANDESARSPIAAMFALTSNDFAPCVCVDARGTNLPFFKCVSRCSNARRFFRVTESSRGSSTSSTAPKPIFFVPPGSYKLRSEFSFSFSSRVCFQSSSRSARGTFCSVSVSVSVSARCRLLCRKQLASSVSSLGAFLSRYASFWVADFKSSVRLRVLATASFNSASSLTSLLLTEIAVVSALITDASFSFNLALNASTSSVSTNAWKLGTNSFLRSFKHAFSLHCGHLPPLPFFFRVSHVLMQSNPKTCPHFKLVTWCAPCMEHGSKHTEHASASSGGGSLCDETLPFWFLAWSFLAPPPSGRKSGNATSIDAVPSPAAPPFRPVFVACVPDTKRSNAFGGLGGVS